MQRDSPRRGSWRVEPSASDCKETPCLRNTLELVFASILELEPRAADEILHRARNEHLAGSRHRRDTCADRDRDPRDLAVAHLALAGVESCSDLDLEGLQRR